MSITLAGLGMFFAGLGVFFIGVGVLQWTSLQARKAKRDA